MKISFLYLIFLLSCQVNNSIVKIEGVKKNYNLKNEINFLINNTSKSKIFYYVSIDYYQNKEWRELVNDINNPKSNSSLIQELNSGKQIKKSIILKKIFYIANFSKFEKYRLKVVYGNSIQSINENSFSNSFEVVF